MSNGADSSFIGEISGIIADRMGLHFPEERWPDLVRGLKAAGRELGFENPDSVSGWLAANEMTLPRIETLASHLTVGETYFFREPASFELLAREILPSLAAKRSQTGKVLRLWSAGCCTGEEAYSLAITCARAVPDLREWNASILATDINPRFLRKAEAGVYSAWSFRGTPDWAAERFFSPAPKGGLRIDPAIKRLVHFRYLNLAVDPYPSPHNHTSAMDVIFCRNVLMYLTPGHQEKVVANLYHCLVDGGYLVVNPAEAGTVLFHMFAMENHGGVIVYRKTSSKERAGGSPSFLAPAPGHDIPVTEPAFLIGHPPLPPPFSLDGSSASPGPGAASPPLSARGKRPEAAAPRPSISPVESGHAPDPLSLARARANQGRLDEALLLCKEAAAMETTNPAAHFLCAAICHELGQFPEAIAAFGRVLYLDQDDILAHHALGMIYKQLGKPKESRRHLAIALNLLSARSKDEVLPESGGITCGRLVESVRAMNGG